MKKKKKKAPTIEDEARRFLSRINDNLESGYYRDGECMAFAEALHACAAAGLLSKRRWSLLCRRFCRRPRRR